MQPKFGRPSVSPEFLREQESLDTDAQRMLSKLVGNDPAPAPPPKKKREKVREDRSHRTTVWLSPGVQRRIRIRALERGQTVSAYLLGLLAQDGIVDDEATSEKPRV